MWGQDAEYAHLKKDHERLQEAASHCCIHEAVAAPTTLAYCLGCCTYAGLHHSNPLPVIWWHGQTLKQKSLKRAVEAFLAVHPEFECACWRLDGSAGALPHHRYPQCAASQLVDAPATQCLWDSILTLTDAVQALA